MENKKDMSVMIDSLELFMAREIENAISKGERYIGFVINGKTVTSHTSSEWSRLTPIDLNNEEVRILARNAINKNVH